jgi:hypothetical protein
MSRLAGSDGAWKAGLTVSVLVLIGLLTLGLATGSFGFAYVLGTPFVGGYVIGRWVRVARVLRVLLAVVVLGSIILGAVTTSLAGAICGAVFFVIASIPLMAGVFLGSYLYGRKWVPNSAAGILLVALLIPTEHAALPLQPIESVRTSVLIEMKPDDAFSRITFYEDASGSPPRLLKIALPRPIKTLGVAKRPGDRVRCVYDTGYIDKEITTVAPGRLYEFKVINQVGVENHAVALLDGSFRFAPEGPRMTNVTLTTRYRPKLSARIAWRPFERAVIRTLHEHVLDAMFAAEGHDR